MNAKPPTPLGDVIPDAFTAIVDDQLRRLPFEPHPYCGQECEYCREEFYPDGSPRFDLNSGSPLPPPDQDLADLREDVNVDLYPDERAAGVSDEEIRHCVNAVGELADEQGLVVITPDVVKLLIRERALARVDPASHRAGDHRAGRRLAALRARDDKGQVPP
jgi:hypothetical protein